MYGVFRHTHALLCQKEGPNNVTQTSWCLARRKSVAAWVLVKLLFCLSGQLLLSLAPHQITEKERLNVYFIIVFRS